MTTSPDASTRVDLPSPEELGPGDSPDLVADPAATDDPTDALDEPVELAWESDPADAADQIREIGYDDDHDRPA